MKKIAPRRFNTSGLCFPQKHYMVNPLPRLEDVESLVKEELYFTIHAPRQTGQVKRIVQTIINGDNRRNRASWLDRYLDCLGLAEGYLVIFDPRDIEWEKKFYWKTETYKSRKITMVGL